MEKFRNFLMLLIISLVAFDTIHAQRVQKNPIKVLYVGYDPARPMPESTRGYPGGMSKEAFIAEYPVRMKSYKELLEKYFATVGVIDCRDWKPENSEAYDVTIFDFKPDTLPSGTGSSAARRTRAAAKYLPDNFSKPVVFIANTAAEMGRSLGLKLDWLCLCLDADAHHINMRHKIFSGPVEKVIPTLKTKKSPEGIYHYPSGDTVPKEIPMWRVQNVGYLDGTPCRIGLVSRGGRFTEGPDAEVISSGVCMKDVGAVALGRHGNYFLWGFGASPADMTEEGKKVFVNVIAYMKQFNGKLPITKKYNEYMMTTDDLRERVGSATKERYAKQVEQTEEFNETNAKIRKDLMEKKASGQKLTAEEEATLQREFRPQPVMKWEEYAKILMGKYAEQYSNDPDAFQKFMAENMPYIYCNAERGSSYEIDEDVKSIGISNHKVELLEKCIDMLKKNERSEVALRVLHRYTSEKFSTADEWIKWLSRHKKKLYFSETNGYKFMINTYNS